MSAGSLTLGGNLSIAVGPLGRNAEGSGSVNTKGRLAAMYSYSKTKGLFGGVSVEGSVIVERQDANRLAYGGNPTAKQILSGSFDPPDWAYILIDELNHSTGMPGGHEWVDDERDSGAMGWSSPAGGGKMSKGYAFGEGVGAGGTSPSNRKRSGSLLSLGKNKDRDAALPNPSLPYAAGGSDSSWGGRSGAATPPRAASGSFSANGNGDQARQPPSRPWEGRRASSYIPFSGSVSNISFSKSNPSGERRAGPSSETYNNGAAVVSRPRAESNPRRPYALKPTPSPFATDVGSLNGSSRDASPFRSPAETPQRSPSVGNNDMDWGRATGKSNGRSHTNGSHPNGTSYGNGHSDDSSNGYKKGTFTDEPDLLGSWDSNERGLTASFARMNTNGYSNKSTPPNRSRRSSTLPFEDIAEDAHRGKLRDTPTFDNRRAFSTSTSPPRWPGSNNGSDGSFPERRESPFSQQNGRSSSRDRPIIQRKAGLDTSDGYARAVALFDFAGNEDGDLGLKKGQVIMVLDVAEGSSDWWRGRPATGSSREGIFPATYVEVLDIPRELRGGVTKSQLKRRVHSFELD